MEQRDRVPGLGRGLSLLAHLGREGACSLERLARDLSVPKSSASRLLESLILAGCVSRDPVSKRFRARRILVEHGIDAQADVRAVLAAAAVKLAATTGYSVEWFAWCDRRLVMLDRADPEDRAVVVRARLGWVRPLDEVDALVQIVIAHGGLVPLPKSWRWSGGKQVAVARETAQTWARRAAKTGWARDAAGNSQGVIRAAAPVFGEGSLLGVLALACPAAQPPDARALAALSATAGSLSRQFSAVSSAKSSAKSSATFSNIPG